MSDKGKDWWDKIQSVSTIIGTVVLGCIGLYYTVVVKDVQDRQDKNADRMLAAQSEAWKEADASREAQWKEQQARLAQEDAQRDLSFKDIESKNSQIQTLLQMSAFLSDKDDATRKALLAASQHFGNRNMTAAFRDMVFLKHEGNAVVAAVSSNPSPVSDQAASDHLSEILSYGNTLAAQSSFNSLPTGVTGLSSTLLLPNLGSSVTSSQSFLPSTTISSQNTASQLLGTSQPTLDLATPTALGISGLGSTSGSTSGNSIVPSLNAPIRVLPNLNLHIGESTDTNSGLYITSDFQKSFELSQKLKRQVVRIVSGSGSHFKEGTAFYANSTGLLITVASAVDLVGSEVTVVSNNSGTFLAKVIWKDSQTDGLAVLDSNLSSVPLKQAPDLVPAEAFVMGQVDKWGLIATRAALSNITPTSFEVYGLTLTGFRGSPVINSDGDVLGILLDDGDSSAFSKVKRLQIQGVLRQASK